MAVCLVLKGITGWNVGDHVEAFGERLEELKSLGVVSVLVEDKVEVKEEVVIEVKPEVVLEKSKKKGVSKKWA